MKKNKLIKLFIIILSSVLLFSAANVKAGYMYSSDKNIIICSDGFAITQDNIFTLLSSNWSGLLKDNEDFGNEVINNLSDMYLYKDNYGSETIYITDAGSNRLFIFDKYLNYQKTIKSFPVDTTKFTKEQLATISTYDKGGKVVKSLFPGGNIGSETEIYCYELAGVYRALRPKKNANGTNQIDEITKETIYEDIIYLCDSKNNQILLLDSQTFHVVQVVTMPSSVSFADKFSPTRIVTDTTGRMYVISPNIFEGIVLISYQGTFMRMVGVNYTKLSVWDALKRNWKTEEQLATQQTIVQTSFNNLTIDSKNFLYTVSGAIKNADGTINSTEMIKKINQASNDVLKRTGYAPPQGDLIYARTGANAGASNFTGITINDYGIYTVVDSRNKRLFSYSDSGDLLYISGGPGNQVTNINLPVAVVYQGENLLVLDKGNKALMRFETTEFAKKVNQAIYYQYIGDETKAARHWQDVLKMNPQYELAYFGVGKKLYADGRYQEAMLYFDKGANVKYYSRAYKFYRDNIIKKVVPPLAVTILILAIAGYSYKFYKQRKSGVPREEGGDII